MTNKNNKLLHIFSSGFGIIEVLIALLIISLAMKGIMQLSLASLAFNKDTHDQLHALILSESMINKLHANHTVAKNTNLYQLSDYKAAQDQCVNGSYPKVCKDTSCSPEEMAEYDINMWRYLLSCYLPGSIGAIKFTTSGSSRIYTVSINLSEINYVSNLQPIKVTAFF